MINFMGRAAGRLGSLSHRMAAVAEQSGSAASSWLVSPAGEENGAAAQSPTVSPISHMEQVCALSSICDRNVALSSMWCSINCRILHGRPWYGREAPYLVGSGKRTVHASGHKGSSRVC